AADNTITTITMAETAAMTKAELLEGKLVQEIAKKGDHVPDEFLHKDGFPEGIDAPNMWRDTLLIDYSLLSSSSTSELAKLRSALSQWGCFQCWPQKPENFRQMIDEYSRRLAEVNEVLRTAIAKSLNLEETCLYNGKQGPKLARFNFYPRCSSPESVLGTKGHADTTTLTYLLPENNVEGLQICSHVLQPRISVAIAHQPQLYRKFSFSEYMLNFRESFRKGSKHLIHSMFNNSDASSSSNVLK
ncbi:hypothetical protein RDABS01_035191, partial [Bienertia sinuspersici]